MRTTERPVQARMALPMAATSRFPRTTPGSIVKHRSLRCRLAERWASGDASIARNREAASTRGKEHVCRDTETLSKWVSALVRRTRLAVQR